MKRRNTKAKTWFFGQGQRQHGCGLRDAYEAFQSIRKSTP